MTSSETLAERARDALRIVESDPRARVRFVAAYAGHGDAVAALRQAVETTRDSSDEQRQRELRKAAFGRTHGLAEERAAAEARRTLLDAERVRTDTAAAVDAAIRALHATTDARVAEHPMEHSATPAALLAAAPPPPPSRMRFLWVLPIVVVCLAVAYIAGAATRSETVPVSSAPVSSAPTPSHTPVERLLPSPPFFPGPDVAVIRQPGDPIAAGKWFDRPQAAQDQFEMTAMLASMNIEPPDVRFVQADLDGFSIWVAKDAEGQFCLLGSFGGTGYGSCTPPDEFARSGVLLGSDHNSIRWDGTTMTVSTTPDWDDSTNP
jgi:hypothetical protein